MNTDKLKYLVEVEKMRSISRAAENLHISQSAVSQTIAEFEKIAGYPLFERKNSVTIPTDKGKILLDKAKVILEKVQDFESELLNSSIQNEIRIGTYPGFMPNFVQSIGKFKKYNKDTKIFITENDNDNTMTEVKEQRLEAGFVLWPNDFAEKSNDLVFAPMTKGRFILCVNKNFKYANRDFITHEELKDIPVILYEDKFVQQFVDEYEEKYGKLNILFTSNQADAARNALIENLGVLIGPNFTFISDPNIKKDTLSTLEVIEFQNTILNLGWITSRKRKIHPKTRQFINLFNSENDWLGE